MTRAVLVNGVPATGKTTVAHAIGARLGVPVLELDAVSGFDGDRPSFQPGGQPTAHPRARGRKDSGVRRRGALGAAHWFRKDPRF